MPSDRSSRFLVPLVIVAIGGLGVDIALRWTATKHSRSDAESAVTEPSPPTDPAPAVAAPVASAATEAPVTRPADTTGASVVLLDDMGRPDNGIDGAGLVGYWYTYSDGTGQVDPAPGSAEFAPVLFQGRRARRFSGSGQEKWGAGFGFDVSRGAAGAKSGATFDASAFSGIQFDVLSKAAPTRLLVSFPDIDTDPRGGVCDKSSSKTNVACFGDYGLELDIPQGSWVERRVSFSQISLPAWSKLKAALEHGFRKSAIYSIHFSVRPDGSKLAPFDVLVTNVFLFV